jgi:L-ascorbate metabolism protein UlaG (beta-lactamase superfamily)
VAQRGLESELEPGQAIVSYLFHSGWAVKTKGHLLIFDYTEPPGRSGWRSMDAGSVEPAELDGQNVAVFVSHAHSDHFNPEILKWRDAVKAIRYVWGWEGVGAPEDIHFGRERRVVEDRGLEVLNIYHEGDGTPESSFLVRVDGLTIFHAGDHGSSRGMNDPVFGDNIRYLAGQAPALDLMFTPTFGGEVEAIRALKPSAVFPMHDGGRERQYAKFAQKAKDLGLNAAVGVADKPGALFYYAGGKLLPLPEKSGFSKLAGPYLGQKPPGMTPELFTPEIFPKGSEQHDLFFGPGGLEAVWAERNPSDNTFRFVWTRSIDGIWSEPVVLSFSTKYVNVELNLSPDGKRRFFASNRPSRPGGEAEKMPDIWMSEKAEDGWGEPQRLGPPINSPDFDGQPFCGTDGKLYFMRQSGKVRQMMCSPLTEGASAETVPFGIGLFQNQFVGFCLSPDGKFLFFSRERRNWWIDSRILDEIDPSKKGEGRVFRDCPRTGNTSFSSPGEMVSWILTGSPQKSSKS